MAESKEKLKSLLMKVKEKSEKPGLKFNTEKTKIMASSTITSCQIDGEKCKEWQILFSWAPKSLWINCSHKIKRHLLPRRKALTSLDSILKSRDITLPTKVCIVKATVFPVVMYRCDSWTIKKLSAKELMLLNCSDGEDYWQSLGQQVDQTSQS